MEKITVTADINADIDKVWKYWTEPEHITKWNFASDDWQCPWAKNELTPGGKYSARMEAKDGSFGFEFESIYDEIIENEKIAYTMLDGRVAITDFESIDGTTRVTTVFDAESENAPEMQQQGWQAILENFRKHVESD